MTKPKQRPGVDPPLPYRITIERDAGSTDQPPRWRVETNDGAHCTYETTPEAAAAWATTLMHLYDVNCSRR